MLMSLCVTLCLLFFFFFNDTATTEIYTLSLHDALPILNFYINRAGKNLSEERHKELEKAKGLLSEIIRTKKEKASPKATARTTGRSSTPRTPRKRRIDA